MVLPEKRLLWHPRQENKFVVGGGSQITLYEWAREHPRIRHVTSQQDLQYMKVRSPLNLISLLSHIHPQLVYQFDTGSPGELIYFWSSVLRGRQIQILMTWLQLGSTLVEWTSSGSKLQSRQEETNSQADLPYLCLSAIRAPAIRLHFAPRIPTTSLLASTRSAVTAAL
jgi:hypothetical protein